MLVLTITGLVLALVSIATTWYVWHLQKQRGRVQIKTQVEIKQFDRLRERDVIYSNSNADKAIDIEICIRSRHKAPIQIQSFIIAVPKLIQSTTPAFFIRNWPAIDNIPLDFRGLSLPSTLPPGEKMAEADVSELAVAQALERRGYSGQQVVMLGVFDEKKNSYYSAPFKLEVEIWLNDRGDFLMGFF